MKELETERLILRKLRSDDCDRIFSCWANDEVVTRYLTWLPHESVDVTRKILNSWLEEYSRSDCYRFGIELKESRQLIGMLDVVEYINGNPEIGYVLGREYWNHGYMTEAFAAVIQYLFEEGFYCIYIRADERNIGSNAVIKKNSFEFVKKETIPCSACKPELVTLNKYELKR